MFLMRFKLLIIGLFFLCSHSAFAISQCEDVFPAVTAEYDTEVAGTQLTLPNFLSSSGANGDVGTDIGGNLVVREGDYRAILVRPNVSLTFTDSGGLYKADSLEIRSNARVAFAAGDYFFSSFTMLEDSELFIFGSGTVRIYVENNLILESEVAINDDENPLLLLVYGNVMANDATDIRFNGLLYAQESINIGNSIDIDGAFTALNVNLINPEILSYEDDFLSEIDFNGTCETSTLNTDGVLLGYYPFEQANLTANIIDVSGNDNNGINNGGTITPTGRYCRGFNSNGSNTSNITNNAFSTGIDLDDSVGIEGTISFWYQANNDWGDTTRTIFDASSINDEGDEDDNTSFYLSITQERVLSFQFENRDDRNFIIEEVLPIGVGDSGDWHYLSVTWNLRNDIFQLYIDGDLFIERSENNDGEDFDTDRNFGELGNLIFGDNATTSIHDSPFTSADGNFDEVRVYSGVLTENEIQNDMNDVNCIDHYQIHHDLTGLTCAPETLTIKACGSAFNSTFCEESGEQVSLNITASSSNNNSTLASVNFVGETTVNVNNRTAETTFLGISGETLIASNGFRCIENNTPNESNCAILFANTGFIFSSSDFSGTVDGIEDQLSGKDSSVGYNRKLISLQVVTAGATNDCFARNINESSASGFSSIQLAAECTDNSSCTSSLSVDSADILTFSNFDGTPVNYSDIDLGFRGADTASFILNYPEAGSMKLHARYNIPADDNTFSGDFITGEASFTVRPLGFHVLVEETGSNKANPASESANGSAFIGAGENFNLTVTAKQWEADDDINDDGRPDINANLANNRTTTEFNDNISLNHQLLTPFGGRNPNLSASNFSPFNNGVATLTTSWPEVGVLVLNHTIEDNDYFGAGDVQNADIFVGRFTPDHYRQTVEVNERDDEGEASGHGTLTSNDFHWVYTGETESDGVTGTIRYDEQPELRITAYSKSNTVTQNYTIGGDFITLGAEGLSIATPTNNLVVEGNEANGEERRGFGVDNVTPLSLTGSLTSGNIEAHSDIEGALLYTFNDLDHFVYTKEANSKVAPFVAEIPLTVTSIIDSDGITQGVNNEGNAFLETAIPTEIDVFFGRLFIPNSYGPETEPLTIPMQLQFFDGNNYVINSEDNLTSLSTENNEFLITDSNASVNLVTNKPIDGYVYFIDLTSQISTNNGRGKVNFTYSVEQWLKTDTNNDGLFDEDPSASAQFGVFRGNDRIILWREISP